MTKGGITAILSFFYVQDRNDFFGHQYHLTNIDRSLSAVKLDRILHVTDRKIKNAAFGVDV
jgi:hypothetical protein